MAASKIERCEWNKSIVLSIDGGHELEIEECGDLNITVEGYGGYGGCGSHNVYSKLDSDTAQALVDFLNQYIIQKPVK